MIWAVVIAITVHVFAYWIYKIGSSVLEQENHFLGAVGAFLVVFTVAAIGMSFIIPSPTGESDIMAIPRTWMHPVFAAE